MSGLEVHVLGSGSGLPTARRDTTALWLRCGETTLLVDCPGSVVHRLARLGVGPGDLERLLLTHDHVDHVYGLAHLVHAAAIAGREHELVVHAPPDTLATAERILEAHGLDDERYPGVDLRPQGDRLGALVFERRRMRVTAATTAHGRDTRALRVEAGGAVLGHSSDTRYHEPLAELFRGADLLLHDCSGLHRDRERFAMNHSSAAEAGRMATLAAVGELRLIHLSPEAELDEAELVMEAEREFAGRVAVARDGDLYRLPRPGGGAGTV